MIWRQINALKGDGGTVFKGGEQVVLNREGVGH